MQQTKCLFHYLLLLKVLLAYFFLFDNAILVLLRIPFYQLTSGTIVKLELEYGDEAEGTTFHIGNSPTNDLFGELIERIRS
jgi:hypothetical protein